MVDTDVVVVGAGPVRLLLACELRLGGAEVTVLEQLPEPTGQSKALAVNLRSIQLLDRRGLLDRYLAARDELGFAGFLDDKGHFAAVFGLDLAGLSEQLPGMLGLPQAHTERLLAERAGELGVRVERGWRLTGLAQDADGVTAQAGDRCLRARYLVGCDGGRSTVRKTAGFAFPGTDAAMTALVAEATLADPDDAPLGWHRTPRGWVVIFPLPATPRVRLYTFRYDQPDPGRSPVTLDEVHATVAEVLGRAVPLTAPTWLSRFTDTARQAADYRMGRVLLAGDAAHVHSPFGGQGLNLGIVDAVNLGWKLAAVVRGSAPESLLDSYHAERHPVAAAVLDNTRAQVQLMHSSPRNDAVRSLLTELVALPAVNRLLAERISAVDVRYDLGGSHPLVGEFASDLEIVTEHGTTRLAELMRTGRPLLLDLGGGWTAEGWLDRVDLVVGRCRADLSGLLVRPDGHVAWAADGHSGEAELHSALTRWFGEPVWAVRAANSA
ncbi:FAD-dependent monooxygenase [Kutzneria albida]|uniref:FAD-binding domain-containing protein n=1 Tax=Kutzneria albida DSM 43870 TaxID=1449976 RepID=W5WMG0_9PSEU|nr:FAD-dependent monooxygenase [Kutzneria albida]AHI01966.1 hypothetical protein KALB_8609 [Kutzneria albida DSM 43870]